MIEKKKLILIISGRIGIALIFVLAASFASSLFGGKITQIGSALVTTKRNSVVLTRRSEMLNKIEKDISIVGDNAGKINQAYVPVDNILDFVSVVENLAAQSSTQYNVVFGNPVVYAAKGNGENIYSIGYTLTMSGTVYTLSSFLSQFNELPFFADVDSVSVSGSADKGWEGSSSITIQGKVYARQ